MEALFAVSHEALAGDEQVRFVHGCAGGHDDFHFHAAIGNREARWPLHRLGQLAAGFGEERCGGGVRRTVADRQRQAELRFLGYAQLVVADHPACLGVERMGFASDEARGHLHIRKQQDRAVETVGVELAEGDQMWRRETQRIGFEAFGQPPAHGRFLAGVAWVPPIGVPASVRAQVQAKRHHAAIGRQARLLGDQLDRGVRRANRLGERAERHRQQRQRKRPSATRRFHLSSTPVPAQLPRQVLRASLPRCHAKARPAGGTPALPGNRPISVAHPSCSDRL